MQIQASFIFSSRGACVGLALSVLLLSACSTLDRENPLDIDPDPPTVVTTDPPNGASEVDPGTKVKVFFSESIAVASVTQSSITLDDGTEQVPGAVSTQANPRLLVFLADAPLALNTHYNVTVAAEVRDLAGNTLEQPYGFQFLTAKDTTPPRVTETEPAHASVAPIDTVIVATFSEPMDETTITVDSFLVNGPFGTVNGQVSYDQGMSRAVFSPDTPLVAGQRYTAMVTPSVEDVDGNSLVATVTWSFTTEKDVIGPEIAQRSPDRNQTGVPVDASVIAVFNEPLNPLTVDDRSFTLEGAGQQIAGTVAYNESTYTAVFSPHKPLAPNITYEARLTIGIQDLAGNPLAALESWKFSTSGASDTTPPVVLSTQPAHGAGDVDVNLTVSATFNEAVQNTTINASTFTVIDIASGDFVPGEVSYDGPTVTASFRSSAALAPSKQYRATLTSGIRDLAGNAMMLPYLFAFTTAADGTPPDVLETYPENGAQNVSVHSTISLFFSEALDPSTVIAGNFFLQSGGEAVDGTPEWDETLNKVTLRPANRLEYSTTYLMTMTTGVSDLAGNHPPVNRTLAFTTQVSPDVTAPTLTITGPTDGQQVRGTVVITGSAYDDYGVDKVEVRFDDEVDYDLAQSTAGWRFEWDTTQGEHAVADGDHVITVRATDLSGNTQSASVSVSVVNDAPIVLATVPVNLATGVAVTSQVRVDFDRPIDAASAQVLGAVSLISLSEADREVPGTVELINGGETLVFWPGETLRYNTVSSPVPVAYRFTVTTAIQDTGGRPMKQDHSISFTTEASPDRTSPIVVISSPKNGERVLGVVNIEGTASDDFGLKEVAVAFDGVDTFNAAQGLGVWVYTWDTADAGTGPVDDGIHVLAVRATDTSDNTQFATVVVELVNGQPTVLATAPADGANDVSVNSSVTATFDRPMSLASLLGATTLTELNSATVVTGQVTLSPDGLTVMFTPDLRMDYNTPEPTRYEFRISTAGQDTNGNPLPSDYFMRFSTEDDTEPPVTTLTNPPVGVVDRDFYVFEWTGTDNADAPGEILYASRMDYGNFSPFATRTSATYTGLGEGEHVFQVKALDRSNNEELALKGVTFTVDDKYPLQIWLYYKDLETWDDVSVYFRKVGTPILVVIGTEYEWPVDVYNPELNGNAWVDIIGLDTGITLYDDQSHGDFAGFDGHYSAQYIPPDTGETEYKIYTAEPSFVDQAGREPLLDPFAKEFGISPNWGGRVPVDTTITALDNPVILDGDLLVPDGITLTIEAGVEIVARETSVFDAYGGNGSDVDIVVDGGTLIIEGTAADPVVMHSQVADPDVDAWGGIVTTDDAVLSVRYVEVRDSDLAFELDDTTLLEFDHVTVEHSRAGLYVTYPKNSVVVTNSTFRDLLNSCCSGAGTAIEIDPISFDYGVTVEDCLFENVTSSVYFYKSSTSDNALTFRNNVVDGIRSTSSSGYGAGLYLYSVPQPLLVENNFFRFADNAFGLYFDNGMERVDILNNVFVGTAAPSTYEAGIYLDPSSSKPGDVLIQGNLFSHIGGYDSAHYNTETAGFHCYDDFEGTMIVDHNTFENCGLGMYTWKLSGTLAMTNNVFANIRGEAIHSDYAPGGTPPVISNNVTYGTGDYFYNAGSAYQDYQVHDPAFPGTNNVNLDAAFTSTTDRLIPGLETYMQGDYALLDETVASEFITLSTREALGSLGGYSAFDIWNDGSSGWVSYTEGVDFDVIGDTIVNLGAGIVNGDKLCMGYDWAGPWVYLTENLTFSGPTASQTVDLYSLADTIEIASVKNESGDVTYAETTDYTLAGTTLGRVDGGAISEDGVVAVVYRYYLTRSVSSANCGAFDEWVIMGAGGTARLPQGLEIYNVTVTDQTGVTTYVSPDDYSIEGYEIVRNPGGAIGDPEMIQISYSYRSPLYTLDDAGGEVGYLGAP